MDELHSIKMIAGHLKMLELWDLAQRFIEEPNLELPLEIRGEILNLLREDQMHRFGYFDTLTGKQRSVKQWRPQVSITTRGKFSLVDMG